MDVNVAANVAAKRRKRRSQSAAGLGREAGLLRCRGRYRRTSWVSFVRTAMWTQLIVAALLSRGGSLRNKMGQEVGNWADLAAAMAGASGRKPGGEPEGDRRLSVGQTKPSEAGRWGPNQTCLLEAQDKRWIVVADVYDSIDAGSNHDIAFAWSAHPQIRPWATCHLTTF